MPRCLLVYSSVTGNTRLVAEAIRRVLPAETVFAPVGNAPSATGFTFVAIGFWAHRGGPDPAAARYMETVRDHDVAIFGTLAAYPDSEHARLVIAKAEMLLAGNRISGSFLCQGKLSPDRLARRLRGEEADERHPLTEERRLRLLEAAKHPDENDLRTAGETFRAFWEQHKNACGGLDIA